MFLLLCIRTNETTVGQRAQALPNGRVLKASIRQDHPVKLVGVKSRAFQDVLIAKIDRHPLRVGDLRSTVQHKKALAAANPGLHPALRAGRDPTTLPVLIRNRSGLFFGNQRSIHHSEDPAWSDPLFSIPSIEQPRDQRSTRVNAIHPRGIKWNLKSTPPAFTNPMVELRECLALGLMFENHPACKSNRGF